MTNITLPDAAALDSFEALFTALNACGCSSNSTVRALESQLEDTVTRVGLSLFNDYNVLDQVRAFMLEGFTVRAAVNRVRVELADHSHGCDHGSRQWAVGFKSRDAIETMWRRVMLHVDACCEASAAVLAADHDFVVLYKVDQLP